MRYDSEHKQRTRQRVLSEAAAAIRTHVPGGMRARRRRRFAAGLEGLTRAIGKRVAGLGKPHPEHLAASMLAEMVGAVALARAIEDPAASERILKTSREALKARFTRHKE